MNIFPHISRIFTAPQLLSPMRRLGTVTLWVALSALLAINVTMLLQRDAVDWRLAHDILLRPMDPAAHQARATALWEKRRLAPAKTELALVQQYETSSNGQSKVLGITSMKPEQLLQLWESEPQRVAAQYAFWQLVVTQKPNYPDAYIQLAATAFQLGKTDEVQNYGKNVRILDPNHPFLGKLDLLVSQKE